MKQTKGKERKGEKIIEYIRIGSEGMRIQKKARTYLFTRQQEESDEKQGIMYTCEREVKERK